MPIRTIAFVVALTVISVVGSAVLGAVALDLVTFEPTPVRVALR